MSMKEIENKKEPDMESIVGEFIDTVHPYLKPILDIGFALSKMDRAISYEKSLPGKCEEKALLIMTDMNQLMKDIAREVELPDYMGAIIDMTVQKWMLEGK